jgi:hypothetical protein
MGEFVNLVTLLMDVEGSGSPCGDEFKCRPSPNSAGFTR